MNKRAAARKKGKKQLMQRSNPMEPISLKKRRIILANQLIEKHLQFADYIEDNDDREAEEIFNDPFCKEKEEQIKKDSDILSKRYKDYSIFGKEEIDVVVGLHHEIVIENPEVQKCLQVYLNKPENKDLTDT